MPGASSARLPDWEKLTLWVSLAAIIGLSWFYTVRMAVGLTSVGASCHGNAASATVPEQLGMLLVMWVLMMVAMMLPSALPTIALYASFHRGRHADRASTLPALLFTLGYLLAWALFSGGTSVGQLLLERYALASTMMGQLHSRSLGGAVLLLAGAFQLTPLKNACLTQCRTPLSFIMTSWREGNGGALRMGLGNGLFCIGCCWALMAILFVAGVMNLVWMGAVTVFVALEKIMPRGDLLARVEGVAMLVAGVLLIASQGF
jgi:predicted metal-binding membrane protein